MIKITKFKGVHLNTNKVKGHQGYVEMEGQVRTMGLPVRSYSASGAISEARRWRNLEGNMQRLEAAFIEGLSFVPPNKATSIK